MFKNFSYIHAVSIKLFGELFFLAANIFIIIYSHNIIDSESSNVLMLGSIIFWIFLGVHDQIIKKPTKVLRDELTKSNEAFAAQTAIFAFIGIVILETALLVFFEYLEGKVILSLPIILAHLLLLVCLKDGIFLYREKFEVD